MDDCSKGSAAFIISQKRQNRKFSAFLGREKRLGSRFYQETAGAKATRELAAKQTPDLLGSTTASLVLTQLGPLPPIGRTMVTPTAGALSLFRAALCRYTSKIRASCGNAARGDLCGRQRATAVPTATQDYEREATARNV